MAAAQLRQVGVGWGRQCTAAMGWEFWVGKDLQVQGSSCKFKQAVDKA